MKKICTLFVMCALAMGTAFADVTTITFPDLYGSTTVQPLTPVSSGAFSFSFSKGNSKNDPAYNASGKEIRLYGGQRTSAEKYNGNTMTVTATTTMNQMVFSGGSDFKYVAVTISR